MIKKIIENISNIFDIPIEAIVNFDDANFADVINFGKWAYIHDQDQDISTRFPFKADVEFYKDINILSTLNEIKN